MERILHPRLDSADVLGISVRKLDGLLKDGSLRAVKIGKRTLIPHSELLRLAKSGTKSTQRAKSEKTANAKRGGWR
jgi:excisionase family DNA binding protein